MSGREVFEGNHERVGAHVIENAKLAQPPPPRAGPNQRCCSCECDEGKQRFSVTQNSLFSRVLGAHAHPPGAGHVGNRGGLFWSVETRDWMWRETQTGWARRRRDAPARDESAPGRLSPESGAACDARRVAAEPEARGRARTATGYATQLHTNRTRLRYTQQQGHG
eukprot:5652048-Prymnesium_polylepis.2